MTEFIKVPRRRGKAKAPQTIDEIKLWSAEIDEFLDGVSMALESVNRVVTRLTSLSNVTILGNVRVGDMEIAGDIDHDGDRIGVFSSPPVAQAAAYVQTYSTATRTHANPTATTIAPVATNVTPWGYSSQAEAEAVADTINALIVDVANVKQVLNARIDDDQAYGWNL